MAYRLITIEQLSTKLGGISRATIYRHEKNEPGFPQSIKVGALKRFVDSRPLPPTLAALV